MEKSIYNQNGTIIALIPNCFPEDELKLLHNWLRIQDYRGDSSYTSLKLDRRQAWFHVNGKTFCPKWKKTHYRWESQEYCEYLQSVQDKILLKATSVLAENGINIDCSKHNSCLINQYNSGLDFIKPHRDSSYSFGDEPVIIGFSVGTERKLILELNDGKHNMEFILPNNSIFVMAGRSQLDWKHSIPIDKSSGVRYSMTFRHHIA
jgi:alkylated DNA repair dioxygenase AlkB